MGRWTYLIEQKSIPGVRVVSFPQPSNKEGSSSVGMGITPFT